MAPVQQTWWRTSFPLDAAKYPKTLHMMGSRAAKAMRAEIHQYIKESGITVGPYFVEMVVNPADGHHYWADVYAPDMKTLIAISMIY